MPRISSLRVVVALFVLLLVGTIITFTTLAVGSANRSEPSVTTGPVPTVSDVAPQRR